MTFVVGASAIVALRILGFAPEIPIESLERLYPVLYGGFWMSAVSGSMLFVADAVAKARNPMFWIKLVFVLLGTSVMWLMRRRLFQRSRSETMAAPDVRTLAAVSL